VARFTALGAKPVQSEQRFNVAHLPKKAKKYVDSTELEAPEQKLKKVGCASPKAKPSMGMKHAKPEPSGVLNLQN
jgi:hypothetical protein